MKRTLALAALLLAGFALAAPGAAPAQEAASALTKDPKQVKAGRYRLDPAHGKITWSISHLGFSTYYGQFTDVSG
ncbi:hypothetical protein C4K41_27905, partial [Escherichia coli]|uniref:YceI family protein n=1 Tax=Escherichia coli TaxID=562 RepID=UPI000D473C44